MVDRQHRVVALVAAAVVVTGVATPLTAGAAPATARAAAQEKRFAGFAIPETGRADGGWIGSRRLGAKARTYRIQPRQRVVPTSYRSTKAVKDLGGKKAGPSARATRRAAFVLANFGGRRLDVQAAAVDAAVQHLLSGGAHRITRPQGRARIGATGDQASQVYAYARAILAESTRFAGPYRIRMSATDSHAGAPSTVTVTVRSARGHGVENVPVRFRHGGGPVGRVRTDSDGQATVRVSPTSSGVSTVSARIKRLPHWRLFVKRAVRTRASDVAVAGRLARRTVRTTIRSTGQQSVRITNAASSILVDRAMAGSFRIEGGSGERSVTSSAYGPLAGPAADCSGPASSVTEEVSGAGPFPLPDFTPSRSGYYRWGVIAQANEFSVAGSACGAAVRVQRRAAIDQFRPAGVGNSVGVGENFRIGVRVSGFDRTEPGHRVTSVLYGPFATKQAVACSTKIAKTKTANVTGNGDRLMGAVSVTNRANAGWYGWRSRLADGDLILGDVSTCGGKIQVVD